MTTVFCRVTAELSEDFVQIFPHQFDFQGLLQKIAEDAGVTVNTKNSEMQTVMVYTLQGLWPAVEKARNMLLTLVYSSVALCEQSQINTNSRPFSALVEAAEAMSRGAELQEQVENELSLIKNNELNGGFSNAADMPVNMNTIQPSFSTQTITVLPEEGIPVTEGYSDQIYGDFKDKQLDTYVPNNSVVEGQTEENARCLMEETTESGILDTVINDENTEQTSSFKERNFIVNSDVIPNTNEIENNDIKIPDTEKSVPVKKRPKKPLVQQPEEIIHVTSVQSKSGKQKKTKPSATQTTSTSVKIPPEIENSLKTFEESNKAKTVKKDAVTQSKPDIAETFECEFYSCDFVAKNRKSYTDHMRLVHLSEPSQCNICNKIFANERYMKRHQQTHEEPSHHCNKCGKIYKVQRALESHLKTHDPEYKPPEFHCDLCTKSFCTNYLLVCHKKSEHLGQKKSFLCAICGKSFTTKHTLQQHANVHTGLRPYSCSTCGKSFSYESALRDHKNIHFGTKKFTCTDPACNKTFRQRSALKMHEKIHREEKDFVCTECGRGFTQKQALQRHIRAHKGDKFFTCKICSRSFGDASIVRRHLMLVHKTHKNVSEWREDVIITDQAKETEQISENEDTRSEFQIETVIDSEKCPEKKVKTMSMMSNTKQLPLIQPKMPRKSTVLPVSEGCSKGYETIPIRIVQPTEMLDHHYTSGLVTKSDYSASNLPKVDDVTHTDLTIQAEAMEYPTVSLLQTTSKNNDNIPVLNYDCVLPVVQHDPAYNLASSSEIDHSGYTKVNVDKTIDDIKVGGPLTLADAAAVAQFIETPREVPILPGVTEAGTVIAGPSIQDNLLLTGTSDQMKIRPEVLTAEKIMEIVKQLQESDLSLMDPQQMQTLYSYYNALATQYFSIAQYAPVAQTTDTSGDHQ